MAKSNAVFSWDSKIIKRLTDAGIVPHDCTHFEIVADVKRPVVLRIERFATREEYDQIVDALVDNPDEAKAVAQPVTVVVAGER